jgi:adenosylcobinamide-GDP ribazoletransferase
VNRWLDDWGKNFFSALSFLTVIPIGKREISKHSLVCFPVVGFLIGLILVLANYFLTKFLPSSITNLFLLVILVILTGGLHIDGFADTCDGFFAGKSQEDTLRIMDDPHIGARGVIALFFLLLSKFLFLENIKFKYPALLLMPMVSRWAMAGALVFGQPAKEEGLGRTFLEHSPRFRLSARQVGGAGRNPLDILFTSIITLIVVFFFQGFKGLLLILGTISLVYAILKYSDKKINGITGDVLGAINELIELWVLCFFSF